MKHITLGDLLSDDQINEVERYTRVQEKAGKSPHNPEFLEGLKTLLRRHWVDLTKKDITPEDLACAICIALENGHTA